VIFGVKASEEEIARSLEGHWQERSAVCAEAGNKMVTNFARSKWRSAIGGSSSICSSERTEAKVATLPEEKRKERAQKEKRREMHQDSTYALSCFA